MIKVALKGLAGRKVRALLTAFAVIIGVSMVSGTFVLTDTMQKSFDGIFETSYENTDVIVSGHQVVESDTADVPTIPSSLLRDVRALDEVDAAAGSIQDDTSATIIGRDGDSLAGQNPTIVSAFDYTQPQLSPLKLQSGEWAQGDSEIAIDAGTAKKHDYAIGDTVGVSANGPVEQYTITGIAKYGEVDSIGGAVIAVFDMPTAQTLLHQEGRYDELAVTAADGTSESQLRDAVAQLAPAGVDVKLASQEAKDAAKETNEGLGFVRIFLLGFGGIALFVGAFVIFNTLSITVAQRTREFATLRTLGASRKQVLRSVRLEGLVIGLLASLVGLVLGIGIAKGMNALFVAFGIDLPNAGTVVATRTIVVSLLIGTGVTLLSSIVPARRATRVPPIAAVREGSELPQTSMQKHSTKVALGVIAAAVAAMSMGVFGNVSGVARRAAARRRRADAVHRRGPDRAAAREAAREPGRLAGAPPRRLRGPPGELELGPQPVAHGGHRRRADGRPHAGHGGRRARQRPADVGERRGRQAAPRRRLRPRRLGRRHVRRRGRRDAGRHGGRGARHGHPRRRGADRRREGRDLGHRPGHDRPLLHVRLDRGVRGHAGRSSATTAHSSPSRTPTSRI